MNWSTPADLRARVQRAWDRGDLLRATVSDAMSWPLRLSLRGPGTSDLTERFEAVRAWVQTIVAMPHLRIEWKEWQHRVQGPQRLPSAAWVDALPDALALIGRTGDAQRYTGVWQRTAETQPALLAWLSSRPLQALELFDRWEQLLAVVTWIKAHPRPGIYLRQVDVPGVDSKFIEAHRAVLGELFDLVLPPDAIDSGASGVGQFHRRYGFRDKPARIRFRLLDPSLACLPGCEATSDITVDADSFACLELPIERTFITENETNFLAFPAVARAIVVFGAGYGWDALARANWLGRCHVHYWGDIDTHGFAILDQLRASLPHARSFLMDRQTLLAHRAHWTDEPEPTRRALVRLTDDEAEVYVDLLSDSLQAGLRLEQERVGFGWLQQALQLIHAHGVASTV